MHLYLEGWGGGDGGCPQHPLDFYVGGHLMKKLVLKDNSGSLVCGSVVGIQSNNFI